MNIIKTGLEFNMDKMIPRQFNSIVRLFVHHREGNGDILSLHEDHIERGWAGCGYNWYIRKDGSIYEGRSILYVPSGVRNNNSDSIHVCFEGNMNIENLTDEQHATFIFDFLPWVVREIPSLNSCFGHRQAVDTDCPGYNFPLVEFIQAFENTKKIYGSPSAATDIAVPVIEVSNPTGLLKIGEDSYRIIILKNLLNLCNFQLPVNSVFDSSTLAAVKVFQAQHGLEVDGIVGEQTLKSILNVVFGAMQL
jgi:N-acetylmuramoyl-L-alanine amidase